MVFDALLELHNTCAFVKMCKLTLAISRHHFNYAYIISKLREQSFLTSHCILISPDYKLSYSFFLPEWQKSLLVREIVDKNLKTLVELLPVCFLCASMQNVQGGHFKVETKNKVIKCSVAEPP